MLFQNRFGGREEWSKCGSGVINQVNNPGAYNGVFTKLVDNGSGEVWFLFCIDFDGEYSDEWDGVCAGQRASTFILSAQIEGWSLHFLIWREFRVEMFFLIK